MKRHIFRLVGYPHFYTDKNINGVIDFNTLFWDFIFDFDKSSRSIPSHIAKKEAITLYLVRKYLSVSYTIFSRIRLQVVEPERIFFAYFIISSYLRILSQCPGGIHIFFFRYFYVNEHFNETNNSLFRDFFLSFDELFSSIQDGDTLFFSLEYSEQTFQVLILKNIICELYKKKVHITINVGDLVEFQNKKTYTEYLKNILGDIDIVSNKRYFRDNHRKLFGLIYQGITFYNPGCSWRKCTFCNIGKYPNNFKGISVEDSLLSLKQFKVDCIHIGDPSITKEQIIDLCHRIIRLDITLKIHLRTRFDPSYTDEEFLLMKQAGILFMGMGLETTSVRLNHLMKKYDIPYTEKDFKDFYFRAKGHGVKIHYYTIFGFPTETKQEIYATKDFLLECLYESTDFYFSYTPGFFGLSQGTYVYDNYRDFDIKYTESKGGQTFIYNYSEPFFDENYKTLVDTRQELISALFIPSVPSSLNMHDFWHFIEESGIFHIQKMMYDQNPYREYFCKNEGIDVHNFLMHSYQKNQYIESFLQGEGFLFYHLVTGSKLFVSKEIRDFYKFFSPDQGTIGEQLHRFQTRYDEEILIDDVFVLVKYYFLVLNK